MSARVCATLACLFTPTLTRRVTPVILVMLQICSSWITAASWAPLTFILLYSVLKNNFPSPLRGAAALNTGKCNSFTSP